TFPFICFREWGPMMKIIKKVLVKQIITKNSKQKLEENFKAKKMRLEQECQQLLFEQRKLQQQSSLLHQEIEKRFQDEINRRKEKISMLDFKLEQLEILSLGSEIVEGEVDALVEVKEGTHWEQTMKDQAIIVKDDVVVAIRNLGDQDD